MTESVGSVKSHFDFRSRDYEKKSSWVNDPVVCGACWTLIENLRIKTILDACGGTGALSSSILTKVPSAEVTVVDSSPGMLARAPDHVIKISADISDVALRERYFDVILLRQALHYLDNPAGVVRHLRSRISKNGVLYVGQIVAPDAKSRDWLHDTVRRVSGSRKATFTINDVLELILKSEYLLNRAICHPYTDNIRELLARSGNEETRGGDVKARWHALDEHVMQMLNVRGDQSNFDYTVNWFHGLFRSKGTSAK